MNTLVQINQNNQVTTTSLIIAETFGKQHHNILKAIERLEIPSKFGEVNFNVAEYETKNNLGFTVKNKMYELTRDGFTLLAMGFTGKKAIQFKITYINAFNEMERTLVQRQGSLPFAPVSLTASDFIHNKEAMKAVGGLVKRCCAVAIREAFRDMFKTEFSKVTLEELLKRCCAMAIHESFSEIFKIEPVKLTFNKNNKHSKELNVIAEAIINYGHTEYKKGKIEGILNGIFDEKYQIVAKEINK